MIDRAEKIARAAGQILEDKLHSGFAIEHKGSIDLVTDADKASEKYVVEQLRKHFPHHGILGEEGTKIEGQDDYVWVIDPLDGTTNFAHTFPYFAVSLALIKGTQAVMGVVYNPMARECFLAELGKGAFLNGKRIFVSKQQTVHTSLLATGFPYDIATSSEDNIQSFKLASKASQGVRSLGAASLDLCQVASGRLEAFWERSLQPWDIAAGGLIVSEAGGRVTSCRGLEFDPLGYEIYASNGLIHEELLEILNG